MNRDGKHPQKNASKLNPMTHWKGHGLWKSGIYPQKQMWLNIWKSIKVIHQIRMKGEKKIISIQAVKEFEKTKLIHEKKKKTTLRTQGIEVNLFNIIEGIYKQNKTEKHR